MREGARGWGWAGTGRRGVAEGRGRGGGAGAGQRGGGAEGRRGGGSGWGGPGLPTRRSALNTPPLSPPPPPPPSYDKAITAFYDKALAAVTRHVDWGVVKCLVLAGPGFAKDAFRAHVDAAAARGDDKCGSGGWGGWG